MADENSYRHGSKQAFHTARIGEDPRRNLPRWKRSPARRNLGAPFIPAFRPRFAPRGESRGEGCRARRGSKEKIGADLGSLGGTPPSMPLRPPPPPPPRRNEIRLILIVADPCDQLHPRDSLEEWGPRGSRGPPFVARREARSTDLQTAPRERSSTRVFWDLAAVAAPFDGWTRAIVNGRSRSRC